MPTELRHFSLGTGGVGRVRVAAPPGYSSEQTRHSVVGGISRQGSPMAAVQIDYRNCGAHASWWRRGLLYPGGAGSLEKKPWVWTTVVGEEGVLNSGPASPPIELAEVGRELAAVCGKQSPLKEVGEVLALVFGVPSTPQDVRQ